MFRRTWKCGLILLLWGIPLPAQEATTSHDPRLFQSAQQQNAFAANLEKLLGPEQNLRQARRQYEIAKRRNPKDPRLDYALGLVLFKQYQYGEAGKLFQAAIQEERIQYLPAWQAAIHLDLLQKDRKQFRNDTLKLSRLAADPETQWLGNDQPIAAANWLGEVCEYLKLPDVDFWEAPQGEEHDSALTDLMTPELVAAWRKGREEFRQKFNQLKNEIQQEQQQTKAKLQKTANRKTAELSDRKQELNKKREDARKSAVEWKAWFDKQKKQTQTQLQTLQRDYATLEAAADRLDGMIAETQLEIGQLNTVMQLRGQNRRATGRRARRRPSANEVLLGQRQQELLRYQLQYAALEQKARSLLAQARQVLAARQQAANKYKNATGQIVRRDQTLARWKKVVEKSSLKAAAKGQNADPLKALENRLSMVSSYFPLNFEKEKKRVLESYESP